MFVFKLLSYLIGYVSIVVRGDGLEKFVNMAAGRGIYLWDISRVGRNKMLIKVRLSAVNPLRHIARQTGSRFEFQDREGMPFVMARLRKRKMLVVGAVIFFVSLYTLSSFVWFIEVTGTEKISTREVLQAAERVGLKRGALKSHLDTFQLEKEIRDQLPKLAWTGIEIKGTKATIKIVEKKLPDTGIESQPAHIVAKKAGLVKEILVLEGNPLVKEGETVVPGQVLISGVIPPPQKEEEQQDKEEALEQQVEPEEKEVVEPKIVHAKGMVRARVWYEEYGEAEIVEHGQRPSGKTATRVSIKFGSKEIILMGPRKIPFKQYEVKSTVKKMPSWRNISIPVELQTEKYLEMNSYQEDRGHQGAKRLAEGKAFQEISKQLAEDAKIINRRSEEVRVGKAEKNLVRVKVIVEAVEDISKKKSFKP